MVSSKINLVRDVALVIFAISLTLSIVFLFWPETKHKNAPIRPIATAYIVEQTNFNISNEDLYCLAQNIHHEAEGESFTGKLAVGIVTLNRSSFYNKTVCKIVFEPHQFSWTAKAVYGKIFSDDTWLAANLLANNLVKIPKLDGAVYFHGITINPSWTKNLKKLTTIGGHIFYAKQ